MVLNLISSTSQQLNQLYSVEDVKINIDRVPDEFSKLVAKKEFQWVESHYPHQIIIILFINLSGHVADLVGFLPYSPHLQFICNTVYNYN